MIFLSYSAVAAWKQNAKKLSTPHEAGVLAGTLDHFSPQTVSPNLLIFFITLLLTN